MIFLGGLRAQDAGVGGRDEPVQAPLLAGRVSPPQPGAAVAQEMAARRALQMGFSSVAAGMYRDLVRAAPAGQERDRLVLDWVVALLEEQRVEEASAALLELADASGPRAALRRGLIAMARGQDDAAEMVLGGVTATALPPEERAWLHYLIGTIADANNEPQLARRAFRDAIGAATSELQRARFELADLRSTWREEQPTTQQAEALRRRYEEYAGERVGYDAAKRYAAVLAALERVPEAVAFLQNQLLALPAAEAETGDDFRLLLGVVAGAGEGLGRNALFRLVADGVDREKQRIALRLLAQASRTGGARVELRDELTRLLAAEAPHRIEPDLLLYRAQLASGADAATRDALALLERFPASDLRPAALGVLVGAAWGEERYRSAAGYAAQARRELPAEDREVRAQLGVLQAEAFFRGGDYRSAADAYAAALDEVPTGVEPGLLVFQEVLARIEENQLTAAASRIDALAADRRLDVINRWQAEWNLALAMQAADRVGEAYARVNQIIGDAPAPGVLPAELAVRMAWLQIRLALEAGEPARSLERAPALRDRLDGIGPELAAELASSLRLLEAEANFALGRVEPALAALQGLRTEHPTSSATVYSYIEEANFHAVQGQLVEAQRLLTRLVELYPTNRYAPFALYQSALMAEGRREEGYLREAVGKIEQLVTAYPDDDLVFYARFKQGDILRNLGQWEPARQVYESIINANPQHPDVLAAQMALADCLAAQAGSDASLQDSAAAIYERLRDVSTAAPELRIEAGLKAGNALARRNLPDRAAETWWQVVDEFLLRESAPEELGTRGRYWLARILARLGELLEQRERLDDARNAYQLIRDRGLPEAEWAADQLARLGVRAGGDGSGAR